MCPDNKRSTGATNPAYKTVFVFDNDFPALLPTGETERIAEKNLLIAETETGICRVLCFSPKHHLTLSMMDVADIRAVVDCWSDQFQELGAKPEINYVQIFENRGAMMGASNPHPHCQIWSTATIPNIPLTEQHSFRAYEKEKHSCLLCDYYRIEKQSKQRIVVENGHFLAVVPFWAVWPFETMLLSSRHLGSFVELNSEERVARTGTYSRIRWLHEADSEEN
ncbi:MAG: hypothetical protein NVS9B14_09090 [Candidatus Acidiferrum sp.]